MANTAYEWYSRGYVQKALLEAAKDREIVSVFGDGRFGKRPEILQYTSDIMQAVKSGTVSFHGSVERWHQPMKLDTGMTKQQQDELRKGWEVLIDMDVPDFDIAKAAARQVINALKDHGVKSHCIKFTGGKSFHIAVPFEAMPKVIDRKKTEVMYPDAMEKIIEYIKWYTQDPLRDELTEMAPPSEIAQKVGKDVAEIVGSDGMEPWKVVDMDIFGSRHMFRLPYSLHERSMLVSLPIHESRLEKFSKEEARPDVVKKLDPYIIREASGDATALVVEAFDWAARNMKPKEMPKTRVEKKILKKIPESEFPPCVKAILNGIADGRKRAVFVIINFLRNMGWSSEDIGDRLVEWNEKNYPPLRTNYIRSQVRWHLNQDRNLLPPNCNNDNFYCSLNVCKPDRVCSSDPDAGPCSDKIVIKNPVNYALRKMGREKRNKEQAKTRRKTRKPASRKKAF